MVTNKMHRTFSIVTPESEVPISTAEAKAHLRVTISDDDALIDSYVIAATQWWISHLRRSIMERTLQTRVDGYLDNKRIPLFYPPATAIDSVKYYLQDNSENTFNSTYYRLSGDGRALVLNDGFIWPIGLRSLEGLVIEYTAGYATPDDVPERVKHAIKMVVGFMYENRETEFDPNDMPGNVKSLLDGMRIRRL